MKREPMKYRCTCGSESNSKRLLMADSPKCQICGKVIIKDDVLRDIERQRKAMK